MKTIKTIHQASYHPIADLITYNPLPSPKLRQIDPFIFLNHHGHQTYPKDNNGLPFGPHPHRGMETVTFILEGDIMHKDSGGHESVINAGGIQWMTAGSGLIHAEVSSEKFKKEGGDLEILQLWLNLPAKLKMTKPRYIGLQKEEITSFELDEGKIHVQLIAGKWEGKEGSFETLWPIFMSTLHLQKGAKLQKNIPVDENVFFYIVKGSVKIQGENIPFRNLVEFNNDGEKLHVEASEDAVIILGHAKPFNEPMVAQGPFVMNTQQEIMQAYQDYQDGKFGSWN
ncbi:putative pirin-related protein [Indibacter alkaliphilus LW1]|jgi:redox-sensitive bicupin YhaK (pirin superfamily)|uniref:Pirin-related protein n=1 Tax=Indibacter alkaliphilus (strain CCUG 57479 / KCTC 22604 / LW1) TaxID=1189612 RepID=S2DM43_INDAL|nr:pirin family protein [Indibacter alkaliphilus]EPA00033.1 putative pirin-related protein [Indibacter alkaliphilus LW1]